MNLLKTSNKKPPLKKLKPKKKLKKIKKEYKLYSKIL
jgi:hypothetical protein